MRWVGHVTGMEGRKMHTQFCWGNLKDRASLKNLEVVGSIVLKRKSRKLDGRAWARLVCFKTGGLLLTR
jgi:hypothetical protein